jgi:molecular chaperone DnaK
MIRNAEGEILTPSVVLFDGDKLDDCEIIVGKEARKAAGTEIGKVAECAKRDIGQAHYSRQINGQDLPPEVVEAYILKKLKEDTERVLGDQIRAVITVPAFFDEVRRKATADAGEMAGLDVLDIVNEPTAAALAFGETVGYLSETGAPREPLNVLVYDLGGGTFDVTVLDLQPGDLRTLATDGDVHLGGYDWDERLAEHTANAFAEQHGADPREDPAAATRLLRAVEEAKHTLTSRSKATIHVEYAGRALDVPISRDEFRDLTEDLLERTSYTTREVLRSSGLEWDDISRIVLVGGSSRMPMVTQMLEEISGITPDSSVYPDEAVARGAAIYARYLLGARGDLTEQPAFKVVDVNSHSLGILGVDPETGRKENAITIPRNSPLPIRVIRKFVTREENQKTIVVRVLEGESALPEHCTEIGKAVLRDLPEKIPQGSPIRVCYEYGANGRLSVHAMVPGTNSEIVMELEREQGLNDQRLTRWKQILTAEVSDSSDDQLSTASPTIAETKETESSLPAVTPPVEVISVSSISEPGVADPDLAVKTIADAPRPTARVQARSMAITVIGYVVASVLGMLIGLALLGVINPDANILGLPLPGASSGKS